MLLYGQDAAVAFWVSRQLKLKPFPDDLYKAIGILHNDMLIGGVVYNNYHTDNNDRPLLIEMTIATVDKHWCSRHNLRELFQYPFTQLGVGRVQATCHRKAKRVRTTLLRLGFHFEGIVREAHPQGGDAAHYSILKSECRWIHGKIIPESSSSARSSSNGSSTNAVQQGYSAL